MPLGFPISGNAAEFVGQVFNLRPILIGLGGRVQMPTKRVENPPQVENLPHIRHLAGLSAENQVALRTHACRNFRHSQPRHRGGKRRVT
jgi:hypothetical protein